jgi:hypothetical protein
MTLRDLLAKGTAGAPLADDLKDADLAQIDELLAKATPDIELHQRHDGGIWSCNLSSDATTADVELFEHAHHWIRELLLALRFHRTAKDTALRDLEAVRVERDEWREIAERNAAKYSQEERMSKELRDGCGELRALLREACDIAVRIDDHDSYDARADRVDEIRKEAGL